MIIKMNYKTITIIGFFIGILLPLVSHSEYYALLIGVGEYPTLPKTRWLEGPSNDVRLLNKALQQRGFKQEQIETLIDDSDERFLPTQQNILNALTRLARKVREGDFVYLHLGGHGARQPQQESPDDVESDGLDEIFLPRDIGQWNDDIQKVERAITDNELNHYITEIRKQGAFVWAVFDTCHSGSMMRGARVDDQRYRQIDESTLGIPSSLMHSALSAGPGVNENMGNDIQAVSGKIGGYVAFYGAQSHEKAPELKLPHKAENNQWHGLLSYAIAEILMTGQVSTYRQAHQRILQRYSGFNLRYPTPVTEGTHLDANLLSRERADPVRQWPLTVQTRSIFIPVGTLSQVGKGAVFAIMKQPQDHTNEAIGFLHTQQSDLFNSDLNPVAYAGKPAIEKQNIPNNAWARLVHSELDLSVTISIPERIKSISSSERYALDVIEVINTRSKEHGIRINWVPAGQVADIRLGFSPKEGACPDDRLWLMSSEGSLVCSGAAQTLSLRLDDPKNLHKILSDTIQSMAKVINLKRLSSRFGDLMQSDNIEMNLYVEPVNGQRQYALQPNQLKSLASGDRIQTIVRNKGHKPIDLTVLFINGRYGIEPVYPNPGELGRINPGSAVELFGTIDEETKGMEYMLAISVEAQPGQPVLDFTHLAQDTLPVARGEQEDDVVSLINLAGFGNKLTRGRIGTIGRKAKIETYQWVVGK